MTFSMSLLLFMLGTASAACEPATITSDADKDIAAAAADCPEQESVDDAVKLFQMLRVSRSGSETQDRSGSWARGSGHNYAYGALGIASCPPGYVGITSEAECQTASAYLGDVYKTDENPDDLSNAFCNGRACDQGSGCENTRLTDEIGKVAKMVCKLAEALDPFEARIEDVEAKIEDLAKVVEAGQARMDATIQNITGELDIVQERVAPAMKWYWGYGCQYCSPDTHVFTATLPNEANLSTCGSHVSDCQGVGASGIRCPTWKFKITCDPATGGAMLVQDCDDPLDREYMDAHNYEYMKTGKCYLARLSTGYTFYKRVTGSLNFPNCQMARLESKIEDLSKRVDAEIHGMQ